MATYDFAAGSERMDARNSILLVDDESSLREAYALLLERAGYRVIPAASATEAQSFLADQRFDLVLTDLRLEHPRAGLDIIYAAQSCQPPLPAILLTAFPAPEVLDEAGSMAVPVLSKPVELSRLLDVIEQSLFHRAVTTELERHSA